MYCKSIVYVYVCMYVCVCIYVRMYARGLSYNIIIERDCSAEWENISMIIIEYSIIDMYVCMYICICVYVCMYVSNFNQS